MAAASAAGLAGDHVTEEVGSQEQRADGRAHSSSDHHASGCAVDDVGGKVGLVDGAVVLAVGVAGAVGALHQHTGKPGCLGHVLGDGPLKGVGGLGGVVLSGLDDKGAALVRLWGAAEKKGKGVTGRKVSGWLWPQ